MTLLGVINDDGNNNEGLPTLVMTTTMTNATTMIVTWILKIFYIKIISFKKQILKMGVRGESLPAHLVPAGHVGELRCTPQ